MALRPQVKKYFPFLKLPAELRNDIYRLVFLNEDLEDVEGEFTFEDTVEIDRSNGLKLAGQFLSTCRQIYLEGRAILYGENNFSVTIMSNHLMARYNWTHFGVINVQPEATTQHGPAFKAIRQIRAAVYGEHWRFVVSRQAIRGFARFIESLPNLLRLYLHFDQADNIIDPRHRIPHASMRGNMTSRLIRFTLLNGFRVDPIPQTHVINGWLGHFRDIQLAIVTGMPGDYGKKLAEAWMSHVPPQNNLAAMYDELYRVANHLGDVKEEFFDAMQAVDDGDWGRFLKIRDSVLRELQAFFDRINNWTQNVGKHIVAGDLMEDPNGDQDDAAIDVVYGKKDTEDDGIPMTYWDDAPDLFTVEV